MPEKSASGSRKISINEEQFAAMLDEAIKRNREETERQLAELIKSVGELKEIISQIRDEMSAFYRAGDEEDEGDEELLEQVEEIMSQPDPGEKRTFVPFTQLTQHSTREPGVIHLEMLRGERR